jgi:hypothetical protein
MNDMNSIITPDGYKVAEPMSVGIGVKMLFNYPEGSVLMTRHTKYMVQDRRLIKLKLKR